MEKSKRLEGSNQMISQQMISMNQQMAVLFFKCNKLSVWVFNLPSLTLYNMVKRMRRSMRMKSIVILTLMIDSWVVCLYPLHSLPIYVHFHLYFTLLTIVWLTTLVFSSTVWICDMNCTETLERMMFGLVMDTHLDTFFPTRNEMYCNVGYLKKKLF